MSTTQLYFFFFFFNDTATTEIYTLSLHDALPIYLQQFLKTVVTECMENLKEPELKLAKPCGRILMYCAMASGRSFLRSEEHTSELQSPCNIVCRLLLEKKKNKSSQAL